MKTKVLGFLVVMTAQIVIGQTVNFDGLSANSGQLKGIIWDTSSYGAGFGHKIYNKDGNGQTYLNFAARNNTATWTDMMTLTSKGAIGIGVANPIEKLQVNGNILIGNNQFLKGKRPDGAISKLIGYEASDKNIVAISEYSTYPSEVRIYTPLDAGQGVSIYSDQLIAFFRNNGNVGIGIKNPDARLAVKGKIHAQEVKVDLNGTIAPDYVFKSDYDLKPLQEVKSYIEKEGHLPDIPSAAAMEKEGIELKKMNLKLLEKIEELTLHAIDQENQLKNTNKLMAQQQLLIEVLQKEVKLLNSKIQP